MTERKTNIELLSPAKDLECGKAAIRYGADAVYIGAPKFGARTAVGNSIEDIASLISYAHLFRAKVYVALNTILFDHELDEARTIVQSVYNAGADGLIVQDMGLLELDLPPIPLIASTQAHNDTPEKIKFLQDVGFQRVILARELSLKQIQEIRSATEIELECFIHGALCVCYSGQCYLSEATQERSANRGECAQPCRLPYTLTDEQGTVIAENKHLLSLKDLNLSKHLSSLIDAGVTSFKIEGRLKDINYVKNVTAFYRQRIDELLEGKPSMQKSSSGKIYFAFQPDADKTFHREFSEHFIRKRSKNILSMDTPKATGAFLGKISKLGSNYFILDTGVSMHAGDGICFFDAHDELCGTNINSAKEKSAFPDAMDGLELGTAVYRNHDHAFIKQLKIDKTQRRIRIAMYFREEENGFSLTIIDEDGIQTEVKILSEKSPAKNIQSAEETIRKQLTKLGDSIYQCDDIQIDWSKPYFLPVSILNELRRNAVASLEEKRLNGYLPKTILSGRELHSRPEIPYPQKSLSYFANVANKKAEQFYRRHGVTEIEPAFELQNHHSGKPAAAGKQVMTMKHCLRFQFGLCVGTGEENAGPLFMNDAKNHFRLEFDCKECKMKMILL